MRLYARTLIVVLAFVASALASPANAQNVTADAKTISAILREQNTSATIEKDKNGDPMIEAKLEQGTPFSIYFYGCQKNANCSEIQFLALFSNTKVGAAEMLKWNEKYRFARVYQQASGNVVIEMDLNLRAGGISRALFIDHLDLWQAIVNQYSELLYPEEAKDVPSKI